MDIHRCRKVRLGPPDGLQWRQFNVSVPYWRVYWNDAPGAFLKDAEGVIELGPDKVVAVPPRTVYSTWAEHATNHFFAHFTIGLPYSEAKPGLLIFKSPRLISLAKTIADAIPLEHDAVGAKLLLRLNVYLGETLLAIPDELIPPETQADPRVEKALALLEANPNISLDGLADALGMSRTSFTKLFRRITGSSAQSLSKRRRLEKACRMLHFGEKSIKQIAEETGFCDRYHFSRAFKKEYKCGPASFRCQIYGPPPRQT